MALVETLAAVGIYVVIAYNYGTLHLAISACVAPLLLLRTAESTRRSLALAIQWIRKIRGAERAVDYTPSPKATLILVGLFLAGAALLLGGQRTIAILCALPLAIYIFVILGPSFFVIAIAPVLNPLCARVVATVIESVRHPIRSIRAVPENWWRTVTAVDMFFPPEGLPGLSDRRPSEDGPERENCDALDEAYDELQIYDPVGAWSAAGGFRELWSTFGPGSEGSWSFVRSVLICMAAVVAIFVPVFLVIALPVYAYRWSLKGTSLVYIPFIYVVRETFKPSIKERLEDIRDRASYKLMRAFAVISLLMLGGKLYLFIAWNRLADWWGALPGGKVLGEYVQPCALAPWHLAAGLNALIAWALLLVADQSLVKHDRTGKPIPAWAAPVVRTSLFVRGVLSIYTIACVLYITVRLVPEIDWPPLKPLVPR